MDKIILYLLIGIVVGFILSRILGRALGFGWLCGQRNNRT